MSRSPRFAFFGTPKFSVTILDTLDSHGLTPALVVSTPDRPRGRGGLVSPTPVKSWALERGIPVLTPESLKKNEGFVKELFEFDLDVSVVAAYGLIIPESVLSIPKLESINVHPSLLPKHRGASPIESQILSNEKEIGVTIMKMDALMDHGPILSQAAIDMPSNTPDALELEKILSVASGELLSETLVSYLEGSIEPIEQDHKNATYSKKVSKSDTLIDLTSNPFENFLKIQAYKRFKPYFITHKKEREIRVIITKASFDTKKHALIIERVIPEGGKEMLFSNL